MSKSCLTPLIRLSSILCICSLLASRGDGAIPWAKTLDPVLSSLEDSTIKQLFTGDFSLGFEFSGVSHIPFFNTGQTTATGARFNDRGELQWAAHLDGGPGSLHQRVLALADRDNLFAAYAVNAKGRVGVYNGRNLAKRFGYEFDLRAVLANPFVTNSHIISMDRYAGNVIGVAQYLGDAAQVMLLDEQGNKLSDRDYSGLPNPFAEPKIALHRLPDLTGFILQASPNYAVCLSNDGSVRWAKSGVVVSDIPPAIGPDGSMLFTTAIPRITNYPDGATAMLKLNPDGSFAWARIIHGFIPVSHIFILGRNPINDGENIWLTGGNPAGALNEFNLNLDGSFLGLVRIDGATGDIIAQTDLVIQDRSIFIGEFAGWTGTHAFFAMESSTITSGMTGHLLKVDGNLENPQMVGFLEGVETTRVSLDASGQNLLYTSSSFNGSIIRVISMDAATLTPEPDCGLFAPTSFQLTNATRTSMAPPVSPPIANVTVTLTDANTPLTPTDFPLVPLLMNEFSLCPDGPGLPVRPTLHLAGASANGTLELRFSSETNVTYEILFASSPDEAFDVIESLPGTGDDLSHQVQTSSDPGQGFYRVRAVRHND